MSLPVFWQPPGRPAVWCTSCHRIAVQPDQHQCPTPKEAP